MPLRSNQTSTAQNPRPGRAEKDFNPQSPHSNIMPSRTNSLHQQKSTEIKMPMVPPGSETGVYVMPIGNLPWNATWQDLKDFARDPKDGLGLCDIEHAEVYTTICNSKKGCILRSAGHGFVTIRGIAHFWRVYNYVNGREWRGQCLMADSRNAFGPISVADAHIGTHTATNHNESSSSSSKRFSTTDSRNNTLTRQIQPPCDQSSHTQPSTTDSSWYHYDPNKQTQGLYNQQPGQSYLYQQYNTTPAVNMPSPDFPQSIVYNTDAPNVVCVPIATNVHYTCMEPKIPQATGGYYVAYIPTYSNATGVTDQQLVQYMSGMTLQPSPALMVETEARKIHIGNLPDNFKANDLKKHIATHATTPPGLDDDAVEHLEIPYFHDNSSRRRKGHAFATFKNSVMAMTCIETLNGTVFKNRKLEIRLTKEGVARSKSVEVEEAQWKPPTKHVASSSKQHVSRRSGGAGGSGSGQGSLAGESSGRSSRASGAVISDPHTPSTVVIPCRQTPMIVDGSSTE